MPIWSYILIPLVVAVILLVRTGWWRYGFVVFKINPSAMTVRRLGLDVSDAEDVVRVESVLRHFLGGFNEMITRPTMADCFDRCARVPVLFRPFAEEGVAMGYVLRSLFRYTPEGFERDVVKPRPAFRYLYYVGLGFWSGMRNQSALQVERVAQGLDPLHRYLVFDGYGFKCAFFDYPKNREAFRKLDELSGYGRNAAYQGVGRALWFRHMGNLDRLIEAIAALGDHAIDAAAGVGLATVFVNPDRIEYAQSIARRMPESWQPHFHLGMCFALKARAINDLSEFERLVGELPSGVRDAVWACIRECDRVELQVRADQKDDSYRRWRGAVTAWMEDHIEFPVNGLKSTVLVDGPVRGASAQTEARR